MTRYSRLGAHVFRHTAASHMVNRGASFKEAADVLGHQSLQTTGIYAKLDLPDLATKEQALQKLAPVEEQEARFTADDPLLAFLTSL